MQLSWLKGYEWRNEINMHKIGKKDGFSLILCLLSWITFPVNSCLPSLELVHNCNFVNNVMKSAPFHHSVLPWPEKLDGVSSWVAEDGSEGGWQTRFEVCLEEIFLCDFLCGWRQLGKFVHQMLVFKRNSKIQTVFPERRMVLNATAWPTLKRKTWQVLVHVTAWPWIKIFRATALML